MSVDSKDRSHLAAAQTLKQLSDEGIDYVRIAALLVAAGVNHCLQKGLIHEYADSDERNHQFG